MGNISHSFHYFVAIKFQVKLMKTTTYELKVQGFHIDRYGHVNNGRYLEYLEMARWDYIEKIMDPKIAEEKGWNFIVVEINIRYRTPAMFQDMLRIETHMQEPGNVKVQAIQKIYRVTDNKLIANAKVSFVFTSRTTHSPLRIIGDLKEYTLKSQ